MHRSVRAMRVPTVLAMVAGTAGVGLAQTNGVWNSTASDAVPASYDSAGNWVGGTIANGAGATADFSQIDLPADIGIDVPTSRTLGHLIFGDSNLATPGAVYVASSPTPNAKITLSDPGGTPTITVNELAPTAFDDVYFEPYLGGTQGFIKQGAGILTLAGFPDAGAFAGTDLSGTVTVAEGTLRIDANFGYFDIFNLVEPGAQTIDEFHLQDGAALELGSVDLANPSGVINATVAAGAAVTVRGSNGSFIDGLVAQGDNSVLNVDVIDSNAEGSDTFSAHGSWGGFGTVNVTGFSGEGQPLDNFRLRPNGGAFDTAGSFANTVVNLDNVRAFVRSNSFGNDVNIAELHGSATSEISGGSSPGGVARWTIGANNNDSDHAGTITPGAGLDLIKNGTGTLTLSGVLSYSPVIEANAAQAPNPDRRGGITTINAGTLALAGPAALPAGTDDTGALGLLWSTVDIQADGTLDVSGADAPYSTADLQQVIGSGTIVGDWTHDKGRLAPGDDNVGNSATLVRTAGTLTFSDSLTFAGGEILFDLSDTPAGDKDLIQVNGATTNLTGGGLVTPNFLGDVPTSGTYTILNSANGFTGGVGGWSVAWPGRSGSLPVSISGNDLVFDAAPTDGESVIWTGNVSADWDVQTTNNFTLGGSPDQFFNGDDVTFNDTASNFNVNLDGDVQPLNVVVDSTTDYTFGGGRIIGFASLTKRGSSTLTINTNNTFTGAATIEGGTVDIGVNGGALGTGALTLAGATVRASNAVTTGMTNTSLTIAAGTTNTVVANGEPTNTASNQLILPNTSGSGDLTVTTEIDGRLVDLGAQNAGFSGTIRVEPTGPATTMSVRFSGDAASGMPDGTLSIAAGVTVNQRQNNQQTVDIGALEGEAGSFLSGFAGGGTAPIKNWRIGALGTSTTFNGDVIDGGEATGIVKAGGGTLTLAGTNSYTGDTTVEDGTLSLVSDYLADASDVFLLGDGTLDLDYSGTDTIDSLFIDGVSQAIGTWGALGSSADFTTALITGAGLLNITTQEVFVLEGDYNNDGLVDAADYTVFRDGGPLLNETASPGVVDAADYAAWAANFGAVAPALAGSAAVPEPTSLVAALASVAIALSARRRGER